MKGFIRVLGFVLVLAGATFAWVKLRPAPKPAAPNAAPAPVAAPAQPAAVQPLEVAAPEVGPATAPVATPAVPSEGSNAAGGPRVWTSRDGRTIKADFISATQSTVTIRRHDGVVFTIPTANLSTGDADWVAQQPKKPEPLAKVVAVITQKQLDELVARFPSPPTLGGHEVTNELAQLHSKYLGMVKFIRPNTVPANLKMIRTKIEDDIKRLGPIAQTAAGDWSGKRLSTQSAAAENGILSARAALGWLQTSLSSHIQAYESLAPVE